MTTETDLKTSMENPLPFRERLMAEARGFAGDKNKLRSLVLERLKELKKSVFTIVEDQLMQDGLGRACAQRLCLFQDELITLLYNFTTEFIYPVDNPSSSERMAILATGGYGRGLMAPYSDIDLLFLLPYKQTPWGESVAEYILYFLWDLGFKVGHATRSVDQCIRLSQTDFTIRTSILDARLIWGDRALFEELRQRFDKDVVKGSYREFIEAKLAERDERYKRSDKSRYRVEPNVKEGKGGLRDLHTLYWIAKYVSEAEHARDFVQAGVFNLREYRQFIKCEDFLWSVRCHLHFLTKRPEERLSFDVQQEMAQRLGYRAHVGLKAVERFMKHYFMVAKQVGILTASLCLSLEIKELKSQPKINKLISNWRKSPDKSFDVKGFKIEHGRLNAEHKNIFTENPVNLIRLFCLAEEYKLNLHPEVLRLIQGCLSLIDNPLRENPEANRIFLDLLCSPRNSEVSLRKMNETGVLGRFVPDFGKVVSMMQFNMYHHYTVDEHLIRTVGVLNEIEMGESKDEHPISTRIISTIQNRRALYVAAFLHDIAKGRQEDHSTAGMKVAYDLCPRLGLSGEETEDVAWLVEHHLDMSQFAQSRDIHDPKTIRDFAEIVKTKERLKLLLILTVADIRAVGPGVWNGWKRQLLQSLYYETEPVLAGENTVDYQEQQVKASQERLVAALQDWTEPELQKMLEGQSVDYWLRTDLDHQIMHARHLKDLREGKHRLSVDANMYKRAEVTELTIFTPTGKNLLVKIVGACAASGANIVEAQIYTTRDGFALDTISLQRAFEREEDEQRRADKITETLQKLLAGHLDLADLNLTRQAPKGVARVFHVKPRIVIDNRISDEFTVIEVAGLDRPGFLYHVTQAFSELKLDISSAHIATFGEKAVDVFYVTDINNQKITDQEQKQKITQRLIEAIRL